MDKVQFHSDNLQDTKAREKREIFVNVEEKKTIKQSAEEFQKKFTEARAHAAESRAKIENPGADSHGVIRSHSRRPFPTKLAFKLTIPFLLLAGIGFAIYSNWNAIHHEFFEVSEERAYELVQDNPSRFIKMYDSLISNAKTAEDKATLYLRRSSLLEDSHPGSYTEQVRSDIYAAEELYPSYTTARFIINFEETYGSASVAEEWTNKLAEREGKEITLGNG